MNENLAYWQLNFTSKPSKFSPRLHGHAGKIQEPKRPQTPSLLYSSAYGLWHAAFGHPLFSDIFSKSGLIPVVRVYIGVVIY